MVLNGFDEPVTPPTRRRPWVDPFHGRPGRRGDDGGDIADRPRETITSTAVDFLDPHEPWQVRPIRARKCNFGHGRNRHGYTRPDSLGQRFVICPTTDGICVRQPPPAGSSVT